MSVYKYPDGIVLTDETEVAQATFSICDDCGEAYLDPPYYTFEIEACTESMGDLIPKPHVGCTGNLCPSCADTLQPDDEDDPRRQEIDWVEDPITKKMVPYSKGVRG